MRNAQRANGKEKKPATNTKQSGTRQQTVRNIEKVKTCQSTGRLLIFTYKEETCSFDRVMEA